MGELHEEFRERLAGGQRGCRARYTRDGLWLAARFAAHRMGRRVARARERGSREGDFAALAGRVAHRIVRSVRTAPALTVGGVVALALTAGSAALAAVLFDRLQVQRLPYEDPENVLVISGSPIEAVGLPSFRVADEVVRELPRQGVGVSTVGIGHLSRFDVGGVGDVPGLSASPDWFRTLGLGMALGPGFTPSEAEGAADEAAPAPGPEVVLSWDFWREHFAPHTPEAGLTIEVGGRTHRVVGVVEDVRHWPVTFALSVRDEGGGVGERQTFLPALARVAPGTEPGAVEAALASGERSRPGQVSTLEENVASIYRSSRSHRLALPGVAVLLLLILAALTVSGLFTARMMTRRVDIGVRLASGAHPSGLRAEIGLELVAFALLGGGIGWLMAMEVVSRWGDLLALNFPGFNDLRPEARVRAIAAAATLGVVLLTSSSPFLVARRYFAAAGSRLLTPPGRRRPSFGRSLQLLVSAEIAAAVLLVGGSVLAAATWHRVHHGDTGFESAGLFLVIGEELDAPLAQEAINAFSERPEVESVGYGTAAPSGGFFADPDVVTVRPGTEPGAGERTGRDVGRVVYGGDYFRSLGISPVAGRLPDPGAPGAVMSETAARAIFGSTSPVGREIRVDGESHRVAAVVADVPLMPPFASPEALVYLSGEIPAETRAMVTLRIASPSGTVDDVRALLKAVGLDGRALAVAAPRQMLEMSRGETTTQFGVATALGLTALVIFAIGISGLLGFLLWSRTREISVRQALGAPPMRAARSVLRDVARVVVVGTVAGTLVILALRAPLDRWLDAGAFSPVPAALGGILLVLVCVGIVTAHGVRRVVRAAPGTALREG